MPKPLKGEKNEFLSSVIALTPDEIAPKRKRKRRVSGLLFDNFRRLILLLCSITLVVSLLLIFESLGEYAAADEMYGGLVNQDNGTVEMLFASPSLSASPDYEKSQTLTEDDIGNLGTPPVINKEFERMKIKLTALKEKYPDLYGWIVLPGTVINYPIMQTEDNDYYLEHSYKGTPLKAGAIFADYRCHPDILENRNLVVYGHHMTNNSMFNSLDSFLKESFFETNNIVYIYTLDGMYTYEIFSVYETNQYYPYIRTNFPDDEVFLDFAEEMRENSIYRRDDIVFTAESQLLTLSTCTNRSQEGRLAVQAILVDAYVK